MGPIRVMVVVKCAVVDHSRDVGSSALRAWCQRLICFQQVLFGLTWWICWLLYVSKKTPRP